MLSEDDMRLVSLPLTHFIYFGLCRESAAHGVESLSIERKHSDADQLAVPYTEPSCHLMFLHSTPLVMRANAPYDPPILLDTQGEVGFVYMREFQSLP